EGLINSIWSHIGSETTLVLLSQLPPGFTRRLNERRESAQGGPRAIYYQAETLIFGNAVQRALHPERFIVGCADPAGALPVAFREFLDGFDCPILPMRYESAEL